MKAFHACLLDLDGVIYRGEECLPGAIELVRWLDSMERKVLFLSNNAYTSQDGVAEKLARLGIPHPHGRVLTAGYATMRVIASRFPGGRVFVLGPPTIMQMAEDFGLHTVQVDSDEEEIPDAVFVGLDRTFTHARLGRALRALLKGAAFFAPNRDPLLPKEGGFEAGTGSIVALLEFASGLHPEIIGKPSSSIVFQAMRQLDVTPEQTLMVGDSLDADILAGHAAGVTTALVLTGVTSSDKAKAATGEQRPDFIFPTLQALLEEAQAED